MMVQVFQYAGGRKSSWVIYYLGVIDDQPDFGSGEPAGRDLQGLGGESAGAGGKTNNNNR